MIHNDTEFEEALEKVIAFMEHPPRPGGADDERLSGLLDDLRTYRPAMAPLPLDDPNAERRTRLASRAETLRRRSSGDGYSATLMAVVDGAVEALIRPTTEARQNH